MGSSWWCICLLAATGCEGLGSCAIVVIGGQLEVYATGCLIAANFTHLLRCRQSTCGHRLTVLVINWFADWTSITLAVSAFALSFLVIISVKLHILIRTVFYWDHLVVLVGLVLVHGWVSPRLLMAIKVGSVVQIVVTSCPRRRATTWVFLTVGWFAQVCNAFFFVRRLGWEACYRLALAYFWKAALQRRSCSGHKNCLRCRLLIYNHGADGGKGGMWTWKSLLQISFNLILRFFLNCFIQKLELLVELCNAILHFCRLLQWLLDSQNAQVFFVEPVVFLSLSPVDAATKDLTVTVLGSRFRPILFVFRRYRATGNHFRRLNLN